MKFDKFRVVPSKEFCEDIKRLIPDGVKAYNNWHINAPPGSCNGSIGDGTSKSSPIQITPLPPGSVQIAPLRMSPDGSVWIWGEPSDIVEGCPHEFKRYVGFSESYDYCVHCDKKEKI
jgi:hypothetical protein